MIGEKFFFEIPEMIELISQILIADIFDTKNNYWHMYIKIKRRNSPRCRPNFSIIEFTLRQREAVEVGKLKFRL